MNRAQKAEFIEGVRGRFQAAPLLILTDFKGSTVLELDELRRACETVGAEFQVVKNTLSKLALKETEKSALGEHFSGNVGVIFSGEDPIAAAKLFRTQLKSNGKLQTRVGFFEGDVLDPVSVDKVADLPSKEELLSSLLATIQEAPRQVLGVIQGPARDLLYLLNNYANTLEDAE